MSNYNYKERTESLKILSKKKESLESRIKIEENQILEIKNKINLLKDQILEIENRWKDLQNKYKGAYEISRQQGLTKMNKNRSLNLLTDNLDLPEPEVPVEPTQPVGQIQTPPINTFSEQPTITPTQTASGIDPVTKLTIAETALLSPLEQEIRRKQRGTTV